MQGKLLPSLKVAKRSAAFEAIKKLYCCGELSENLLPIKGQKCLDKFKDVYFKTWQQFDGGKENSSQNFKRFPLNEVFISITDNPKEAGTKKNYRMHDIVVPTALIDSAPGLNMQLYLYELDIQPNFNANEANDGNIAIFHTLLQSSKTYGILTTKKLPRMGLMKFYQSFGQISCKVSYDPKPIKLGNAQKLAELKRFHCILFRNVLDLWKEFFVYDQKDSVVIVPTKDHQIDWNIVERFQEWSNLRHKTVAERKNVEYKSDDWLHSVVCPW